MGQEQAEQLFEMIVRAKDLPVWDNGARTTTIASAAKLSRYGASTEDIITWVAMRENDRERLALDHPGGWPKDRQYRSDSLPARISAAFADLLYGETPTFRACLPDGADEDTESPDQAALEKLVEENNLAAQLRTMVHDCSSEGEQWWRVYTNPEESEYPILEFSSRLDVIPLFRGKRIVAIGFITTLFSQEIKLENDVEWEVWRKLEIQTDGLVCNYLFKGGMVELGNQVDLKDLPETANIMPEWRHGLDIMLAGRVPNKLGRDYRLGISDYQGVKDQLFDLNEARTIMAENARLAAKKRAVAPRRMLRADGTVDLGSDVFITENEGEDTELGNDKTRGSDFAILEYTFDASALIAHINELTTTAVTRCGLVEQFVNTSGGSTDGGAAVTGVALRTRLIPTTLTATGKSLYIDRELPRMMVALQQVDAMPTQDGGCGHDWAHPEIPPTIERASILPEDETELTSRHVTAVAGEIESIFTAVKDLHPEWDDDEINKEISRIHEDRMPAMPSIPDIPNEEQDNSFEEQSGNGGQLPGSTSA